MNSSFTERLSGILRHIERAQRESPISAKEIALVAASKTQPPQVIREAFAAGVRHFGENRVQEAAAKWAELADIRHHVTLHLIGPLQTNKVREAVSIFDVIHTLDRAKLADALAKEMAEQKRFLPCLIEVNTGAEPQKAGIRVEDAASLLGHCRTLTGLDIKGFMAVPPALLPPAPHFALLKQLADRHVLPWLSMGMSADYAQAVTLGATHVRVGTALFGERSG